MKMLFIGRYVQFHRGHKYIIDSALDNGHEVVVAIRETDEIVPPQVRKEAIEAVYGSAVRVITIPDIDMVAVGRKVGYAVVAVPEDIAEISGTAIRAGEQHEIVPEAKGVIDQWREDNSST